MPIELADIERARFEILQRAEQNDWKILLLPGNMGKRIQISGEKLGATLEEQNLYYEAFDRMLNDLGWIRENEGFLHKITSTGHIALENWRKQKQMLDEQAIENSMYSILRSALDNGDEIYVTRANAGVLVQTGNVFFGGSDDELKISGTAFDRMLGEKHWVRFVNGTRYATTEAGRKALQEHDNKTNNSDNSQPGRKYSNEVFIVHGHDESTKHQVRTLVTQLGLVPIILGEQASKSRTIIEKFEDHSDVGFAIVLLTPDDEGRAITAQNATLDDLKPRARQNVILELGYFWSKLGRSRVCALNLGVEMPSDFHGVLYVGATDKSWKFELAKEIKAAGYDVDVAKVTT